MPAASEENVELVRRAVAAVNDRDITRYLECCADDIQLVTPLAGLGAVYEGTDEIRRFFLDLQDPRCHQFDPPLTARTLRCLRTPLLLSLLSACHDAGRHQSQQQPRVDLVPRHKTLPTAYQDSCRSTPAAVQTSR